MANQRPEKGQIWRRKRNGYLVEITDANGPHANVIYKAHERKPRQPEVGRKYHSYFRDEFEFVSDGDLPFRGLTNEVRVEYLSSDVKLGMRMPLTKPADLEGDVAALQQAARQLVNGVLESRHGTPFDEYVVTITRKA